MRREAGADHVGVFAEVRQASRHDRLHRLARDTVGCEATRAMSGDVSVIDVLRAWHAGSLHQTGKKTS
jgi:hypothetical protein